MQVCFLHCTDVVVGCSSAKAVVGGPPMVTNEVVQDLKQNMYKLEEDNHKKCAFECFFISHQILFQTFFFHCLFQKIAILCDCIKFCVVA